MITTSSVSKNRASLWLVIILIALLGSLKFNFPQNNILSYDYFGLYLYLPATFIYHDPAVSELSWLENINQTYGNTPMFYQLQPEGEYHLIRFFGGMAMLLSPFFLIGHIAAGFSPYPADGFSLPYQYAMMLAALFYVAVGLVFIRKLLLQFFDERTTIFSLLALYIGSNLFFWTTFDGGAPHTILFSFYALLLWFSHRWHTVQARRYAIAIGVLLGLIIVSRPSEITSALIPLLWGVYDRASLNKKIKLIKQHWTHLVWLVLFTVLMGMPQLAYYYHYTGKFFLSTYNDPQSMLDIFRPRFAWVLFSYRKGWLLYAPIMIFAIIGFVPFRKKHQRIFPALFVYFILNLLILASFTSLVSYGWRAFIQSYAVLALPLAAFIQTVIHSRFSMVKIFSTVLLIGFMVLTVFQSWQIMMGIIHGSRMTKEYYWRVFGKNRITEADKQLLMIDYYMDDKEHGQLPEHIAYSQRTIALTDFEDTESSANTFVITDPNDPDNQVCRLDKSLTYSPAIKIPHKQITGKNHYWALISFRLMTDDTLNTDDLLLVTTYGYRGWKRSMRGKVYKYRTFPVQPDQTGGWQRFQFRYLAPEPTTKRDRLETYLWLRADKTVLVDDFKVEILEPEK
ncbi:MAG: hypothetical protein WCR58_11035 [Bacteroidales bacterium]|jgi:hypothetical protein|nr:hypothetical protein [Bacteroidales bacterium]MDD3702258.1 hypothetical protein [Bacteroidales bacterium]MDY0368867.1 hypothetical protein [Bacteroidales bacterium]